jgi:hypothetical protein
MRVIVLLTLSTLLFTPWAAIAAGEDMLPDPAWRDAVHRAVERFACEDESAFLTCYDTTVEACTALMVASLHQCFEEHATDIPEQVQSDGPLSTKMIECSQRKYVAEMHARFSDRCGEEKDFSREVHGGVYNRREGANRRRKGKWPMRLFGTRL